MANTKGWVSKMPADMTDEELREAKNAVFDALQPTQERLNALSAAVQHLDYEINTRFQMGNFQSVNMTGLPEYPVDYLAENLTVAAAPQ
jgi:hypothetical protein